MTELELRHRDRQAWGHFSPRLANEIGRERDERRPRLAYLRDSVLEAVVVVCAVLYWANVFGLV